MLISGVKSSAFGGRRTSWCIGGACLALSVSICCSPTTPSDPACGTYGSLTAHIDGQAWTAPCVSARRFTNPAPAHVTVSGATADQAQSLGFTVSPTTVGTYVLGGSLIRPLGDPYWSAGLNIGCLPHPGVCPAWFVAPCCGQLDGNGSGTVTLTTLTETRVSGSFVLDMVANSATGAKGPKSVTGSFDVSVR
jgi:hypothetical protein